MKYYALDTGASHMDETPIFGCDLTEEEINKIVREIREDGARDESIETNDPETFFEYLKKKGIPYQNVYPEWINYQE